MHFWVPGRGPKISEKSQKSRRKPPWTAPKGRKTEKRGFRKGVLFWTLFWNQFYKDFNAENMVLQRCPEAFKPYKNSGFSVFSVFMLESVEERFRTPFWKAKWPPFWFEIRLNSDLERSGGFRDRPKSGKKGIGRGSKNGPKNGPRDQRSARTAGHNMGPAEWVLEVSPAECAEPRGGL